MGGAAASLTQNMNGQRIAAGLARPCGGPYFESLRKGINLHLRHFEISGFGAFHSVMRRNQLKSVI